MTVDRCRKVPSLAALCRACVRQNRHLIRACLIFAILCVRMVVDRPCTAKAAAHAARAHARPLSVHCLDCTSTMCARMTYEDAARCIATLNLHT